MTTTQTPAQARAERFAEVARKAGHPDEHIERRFDASTGVAEVVVRGRHEWVQIIVRPSAGKRSRVWAHRSFFGNPPKRLAVRDVSWAVRSAMPRPAEAPAAHRAYRRHDTVACYCAEYGRDHVARLEEYDAAPAA